MPFAYLHDPTLLEVQRAAINLDFANEDQLAAVAADISPAFIATAIQGAKPRPADHSTFALCGC
jgi:hypothetical protein